VISGFVILSELEGSRRSSVKVCHGNGKPGLADFVRYVAASTSLGMTK
jgi:hypothetical protein